MDSVVIIFYYATNDRIWIDAKDSRDRCRAGKTCARHAACGMLESERKPSETYWMVVPSARRTVRASCVD